MAANEANQPDPWILLTEDVRSALRHAALLFAGNNGCTGAVVSVNWNSHSFQFTIDPETARQIERAIWCNWYSDDLYEARVVMATLLERGFDLQEREQFQFSVTTI